MKAVGLASAFWLMGCAAHGSTSTTGTSATAMNAQTLATSASESSAQQGASTELSSSQAELSDPPPIVEPAPDPATAHVLPPEGVMGVIDRAGLVMIIDAGLGRFFQRVRVSPEMAGSKFVGFRITQIDPAWSNVPLRNGDVIRRLNGQPIERPEQAMSAFERLRSADELVVDFTREGVEATVRFAIQ